MIGDLASYRTDDGSFHAARQRLRNAIRILCEDQGEGDADEFAPVRIVIAPDNGAGRRLRLFRRAAERAILGFARCVVLLRKHCIKDRQCPRIISFAVACEEAKCIPGRSAHRIAVGAA